MGGKVGGSPKANARKLSVSGRLMMVEVRGIEPLSENPRTQAPYERCLRFTFTPPAQAASRRTKLPAGQKQVVPLTKRIRSWRIAE